MILYCSILFHCVDLTLFSLRLMSTLLFTVNIHYMLRPNLPSSAVQVVLLRSTAIAANFLSCSHTLIRFYL
jgi:hypothetical protein